MWIRHLGDRLRHHVLALTSSLFIGRSGVPGLRYPVDLADRVTDSPIAKGWSKTSINTVIFRRNAIVSWGEFQFAAFYDEHGYVVLARRLLGSPDWYINVTELSGRVWDAHNAISIAVDGTGILHVVWDHHGHRLNYARGKVPGSVQVERVEAMTGRHENRVTYPQFYALPDGDLLFVYRNGRSGSGDIHLNRYDAAAGCWTAVLHPLIDGQGRRNAYINQLALDGDGTWHLSWCWRTSPNVRSNADILYAVSRDQGASWEKSSGEPYALPIRLSNAEVIVRVPRGSDLINQTSMTLDGRGRPMIATYWKPQAGTAPQYHLVRWTGTKWFVHRLWERKTSFSLGGFGTRRIPISRPQLLTGRDGTLYMLFRDIERSNRISVAISDGTDGAEWSVRDLTDFSVGMWEPCVDDAAWERENRLHLFLQKVGQANSERPENLPPQTVSVLEWEPAPVKVALS